MFRDAVADVVYRVPIKETNEHVNFFVVVEQKSDQDALTIFQLGGYVYRICRRDFLAAVDRGESRAEYRLPPVVAIILHHGDSKFQGKTELSELRVVLMVLKTVLRQDVAVKIKDVLQELKSYSHDPATRRLIRTTWIYLANNAEHLKRSFDSMLDTFQELSREEVMPTMVEIWLAEGKAEGEAIGERGEQCWHSSARGSKGFLKRWKKPFGQCPT